MTTQALESMLPTILQACIKRIRAEYLQMHISKRMYYPYDYFLRMKTIEHLRQRVARFGHA